MTRDEIIRLAEQAGFKVFGDKIVAADENNSGLATESVMRFAELVAAAEREACAKVCESLVSEDESGTREDKYRETAISCAKAIRARSNKGE